MPISNSFDNLEEVLDDINNNEKIEKTVKSLPIFVTRVTNTAAFQLLKKIIIDNYEIKIINNKQVKIQPKNFIVYFNSERTQIRKEFYMYKPK